MINTYLIATQFGMFSVKEESIWDGMAKLRDILAKEHDCYPEDIRISHAWDVAKLEDCAKIEA